MTMTVPDLGAFVRELTREQLHALAGLVREAELSRALQAASLDAPRHDQDGLLEMEDVAKLLAVPDDYAYELGRRGDLPVVKVGRKYVRVRVSAVRAYIETNERKGLDSVGHPRKARGR